MNAVETALSSPKVHRYLLWVGVAVLAAGVIAAIMTFAGGSDKNHANPDKDFHPSLPAKSVALKNADGVTIKTFSQLDPQARSAITTFISTVVARKHLDASWSVLAPSLRAGYTRSRSSRTPEWTSSTSSTTSTTPRRRRSSSRSASPVSRASARGRSRSSSVSFRSARSGSSTTGCRAGRRRSRRTSGSAPLDLDLQPVVRELVRCVERALERPVREQQPFGARRLERLDRLVCAQVAPGAALGVCT